MALDKGNKDALNYYTDMLADRRCVEKDEEETYRYFEMEVGGGNSTAMLNYGKSLLDGEIIRETITIQSPDEKCVIVLKSGLKVNGRPVEKVIKAKKACIYFKMAANKGNIEAMNKYGEMLEQGIGVAKSSKEALRYYKMAADRGLLEAKINYEKLLNINSNDLLDSINNYDKIFSDYLQKMQKNLNQEISKLEFPISSKSSGIFSYLIKSQKSQFDRFVVPSQSSGDVYCIIDPDSSDNYSTGAGDYEWIQFEFKEPITVNSLKIKSAHRAFLKKWNFIAYDSNDNEIVLYKTKGDSSLNGKYAELKINFNSTQSKKFRIEKFGANWSGTKFVKIKNVELYNSDDGDGIFKKLLKNCNGDPHKASVLVTASSFDFQEFHSLSPQKSISTLNDEDSSWFQVELSHGRALVSGYRFQVLENFPIYKWRFACSNDNESWDVVHESEISSVKTNSVFVFEVSAMKAYKYFRFINVSDNSEDGVKLKLRHFEIFGSYFSL